MFSASIRTGIIYFDLVAKFVIKKESNCHKHSVRYLKLCNILISFSTYVYIFSYSFGEQNMTPRLCNTIKVH